MDKPLRNRKPILSERVNCEVIVHGNGFLAHVKTFTGTGSAYRPATPESLKPGDAIRLEIMPEHGAVMTVQLGIVRWTDGQTVGADIKLMEMGDQRAIDDIAWDAVKGEPRLVHWLRKALWGDRLSSIQLTFASSVRDVRPRLSQSA